MLTMVNDMSTSNAVDGLHLLHHLHDENTQPQQPNVPVSMVVKPEDYTSQFLNIGGALSGDESSSSLTAPEAKRPREKRSTKSKCPPGLRSGKWTPEEEAFTNLIIYYFKLGRLHVEDGTSLRWYLAKRLNCEAMRVTKKLKGNSSIGKQIFRALEDTEENRRAIEAAARELAIVEKAFTDSLAATGQPAPHASHSITHASSMAVRSKRVSPHKPMGLPKPPHLEARKLVVPKVRDSLANSEDAKLLLHFFVGAHDATSVDEQASLSSNVEKKRLFSDVDTSPSTASSQTDSPDAKRRSMAMDDLVRTV